MAVEYTIDEACDALAGVLDQVDGLRARAFVDDMIHAPEAQVFERDYDPRLVFSALKSVHRLGVRVFVQRTDMRNAQIQMRQFRGATGPGSVREAIEDGTLWSIDIDYAEVTSIGQPFVFDHPSGSYWCADWDVDVVF